VLVMAMLGVPQYQVQSSSAAWGGGGPRWPAGGDCQQQQDAQEPALGGSCKDKGRRV